MKFWPWFTVVVVFDVFVLSAGETGGEGREGEGLVLDWGRVDIAGTL